MGHKSDIQRWHEFHAPSWPFRNEWVTCASSASSTWQPLEQWVAEHPATEDA